MMVEQFFYAGEFGLLLGELRKVILEVGFDLLRDVLYDDVIQRHVLVLFGLPLYAVHRFWSGLIEPADAFVVLGAVILQVVFSVFVSRIKRLHYLVLCNTLNSPSKALICHVLNQ